MEGRAFRHGDIVRDILRDLFIFNDRDQEDTLAGLVKKTASGLAIASFLGKGSKFGGLDIKRVYFG